MSGIVLRDLIGFGLCWIVSVTRRPTSCAQPEFLTVTWNTRSVLNGIVFRVLSDSSFPLGSAFVETSPVPRGVQFVPPVPPEAAPWMRCQSDFIDAVVAM